MVTRFAVKVGLVAAGVAASGLALVTVSGSDPSGPMAGRAVTDEEKALLHRAEERLVRRCMTEHGFEYDELSPPADVGRSFPYVLDDVAWAWQHGYDLGADDAPPDEAPEAYDGLSPQQQQEWQTTLFGAGPMVSVDLPGGGRLSTNSRGCLAEARRTLYGDLARWFRARRLTDNLPAFVRRAVREDARFARAMTDWAGCMRRRGHDVSDPGELRERLLQRTRALAAPAKRADEIRTAVAEATCANATSLAGVITALERDYRHEVDNAYRRERADLNALELAALPIARQALANPRSSADDPSDESAAR